MKRPHQDQAADADPTLLDHDRQPRDAGEPARDGGARGERVTHADETAKLGSATAEARKMHGQISRPLWSKTSQPPICAIRARRTAVRLRLSAASPDRPSASSASTKRSK